MFEGSTVLLRCVICCTDTCKGVCTVALVPTSSFYNTLLVYLQPNEILPLIIKTSTRGALAPISNTWTRPSAHIPSINPLPPPFPPALPDATVSDAGTSAKRTLDALWINSDSPNRSLAPTSSKRSKQAQRDLRIGTQRTTTDFHFHFC